MYRTLLLLLLAAIAMQAQLVFLRMLPPQLVRYLELTQVQQGQIVEANLALNNFNFRKQGRAAEVQREINLELRKPDPDAMALGVRYRELEAIRRETAAERTRTVETIQALLTPAQKQKLSVLQEALRLQSTACDAVNVHLTTAPEVTRLIGNGNMASELLMGPPVCGMTGLRTGDFIFDPGMRNPLLP